MAYAPVILFVYNRPHLVRQTLESLMANHLSKESELFIYADGPKPNSSDIQLSKIQEVRKIIAERKWCGKVNIIESDQNIGLASSVINGVSKIVNKFGNAIIVEDDVILSPFFLTFMNDGIEMYKDDPKVLSIGSWNYFSKSNSFSKDTFFFRFPDTKGWATFERAWKLFEKDPKIALEKLKSKGMLNAFNADLNYPYFTKMLEAQIEHKINSWAIRWTATGLIHDMVSLFPKYSLSKDVGFGSDATHDTSVHDYNKDLLVYQDRINVEKIEVTDNLSAVDQWRQFYLDNFIPKKTVRTVTGNAAKKIVPNSVVELYRRLRYGGKS